MTKDEALRQEVVMGRSMGKSVQSAIYEAEAKLKAVNGFLKEKNT